MVDSTAAYERDTDAPSYSGVSGDRPAGERAARSKKHAEDGLEGAGPEHAAALLRMGATKQEAGDYAEAEELFRRGAELLERSAGTANVSLLPALTSLASARVMGRKVDDAALLAVRIAGISELASAEQEPDVTMLLNDLARICLKQSAYAVAEPLLLRLLAMKRSKGEDHPEVGTVLASLATVREALGRHESAEQLWRRVLEIRERTLAPNHFAIAIALEHLAESCAARGKIREALTLFQRGQAIRELTLDAGHPSHRISRDRIADLELQAEESLEGPHDTPVPKPDKYRLLAANNSVDNLGLAASPPPVWQAPASPRRGTARVIENEVPVGQSAPAPIFPPIDVAPTDTPPATSDPVPFRDLFLTIQQELDDETAAAQPVVVGARFLASVRAALKERQKATVIGIGVLVVLGVLGTASLAWPDSDPQAPSADASLIPAGRVVGSSDGTGSPTRQAALVNTPVNGVATAAAAATPVTASRTRLADEPRAAKKPTEKRTETARIAIPKVLPGLGGFDSVVSARAGSSREVGETFTVQPPTVNPSSQRTAAFAREEQTNSAQRAQLIGSLPTPRYPAALGGVEGEVRVRFDVDPTGHPVMSTMSVVSSPNALLTTAVLKVIPAMRFEPARSGGTDSKPVSDVVALTFQFKTTK